jgi:hypothetical protein
MSRTPLDRLISLDVESNGLGGRAFAAAITLSDPFGELEHAVFRCPIDGPVDPWVTQNVLPAIADLPTGCPDYTSLLDSVRDAYLRWAVDRVPLVVHVPWPVETRLLLDMLPGAHVWRGPYPLIDVASVLWAKGHDPLSVDRYLEQHGILAPEGSPHHPLYDARAADRCLRHLMAEPDPAGDADWAALDEAVRPLVADAIDEPQVEPNESSDRRA